MAISRRYPIALIDTSETSKDDRLVALAMRSSAVAVPAGHPLVLAVNSECLIDIDAETQSWPDVSAQPDRSPYHEILSAELFNRFEVAREQLEHLEFLGPYRRAHTARRLSEADTQTELLDARLADEGDFRGAALEARAKGETDGYHLGPEHGLIATITGLGKVTDPRELARHTFATNPEAPAWARRLILTQFLKVLALDDQVEPALHQSTLRLLSLLEDVSRLSVAQVSAIGRLGGAQDLLRRVSETGSDFSKMAARQELERFDFHAGRQVDEVGIRNDIAEIDAQSWHEGLWQAGLAYWDRLSTDTWQQYLPTNEGPLPAARATGQTNLEIAELDRTAGRRSPLETPLRQLNYSIACEPNVGYRPAIYNRDRSPTQPGGRYAPGRPRPCLPKVLVLSAIDEVRPAMDLVHLRDRRLALLAEVEADENRSTRFAASVPSTQSAGDHLLNS